MTTRTLSWELSAPTPRQLPIDRTEISIRVDSSLPWSFHDAVAPDSLQQIVLQNVMPGTIFYQLVVFDTAGVASSPVVVSGSLAYDAPTIPFNVVVTDTA